MYFTWPDPNAPPNWQFLGYISNIKPSAIFKISTLRKNHEFENSNLGIFGVGKISHVAQIGISIDPLGAIELQAATVAEATSNSFLEFVQKMLTSFLNYVSSFSVTQAQMDTKPERELCTIIHYPRMGMKLLREGYSRTLIFGKHDAEVAESLNSLCFVLHSDAIALWRSHCFIHEIRCIEAHCFARAN